MLEKGDKERNSKIKWSKNLNTYFMNKDIQMANKLMKCVFNFIRRQKNEH